MIISCNNASLLFGEKFNKITNFIIYRTFLKCSIVNFIFKIQNMSILKFYLSNDKQVVLH